MKLLTSLLSFCVVALFCAGAEAQSDPSGLLAALRSGNAEQVQQIVESQGIDPHIAEIAKAQLLYDVPRLLKLSQACERAAIADPKAVTEALYCNEVAVAAAASLGDAHEMLEEHLWQRGLVIPALERDLHWAPRGMYSALDRMTYDGLLKLIARTPPVSAHWQADSMIVPIDHARSRVPVTPTIQISINGHKVDALLDTGFATSAPLVIVDDRPGNGPTAAGLGLTALASSVSTTDPGARATGPQKSWQVAATVNIGPLSLRNLFVLVANSGDMAPGVYVTDALLRRFGSVRFGQGVVQFSRYREAQGCTGGAAMTFAGSKDLDGWLVFPTTVGNRQVTTALLTGDAPPLVGDTTAFPLSFRDTHDNGVTVEVGKESIHVLDVGISNPSSERPYHLAIGAPVLATRTVTLAFDTNAPEICLSENHSSAATAPDRISAKN